MKTRNYLFYSFLSFVVMGVMNNAMAEYAGQELKAESINGALQNKPQGLDFDGFTSAIIKATSSTNTFTDKDVIMACKENIKSDNACQECYAFTSNIIAKHNALVAQGNATPTSVPGVTGANQSQGAMAQTYKITWVLDGGIGCKELPGAYIPGSAITIPCNPTKEGCTLNTWQSSSDNENASVSADKETGQLTVNANSVGDVTLTAVWDCPNQNANSNTNSIVWDLGDGTQAQGGTVTDIIGGVSLPMCPSTYKVGDSVYCKVGLNDKSCTFSHWTLNKARVDMPYTIPEKTQGVLRFVAQWNCGAVKDDESNLPDDKSGDETVINKVYTQEVQEKIKKDKQEIDALRAAGREAEAKAKEADLSVYITGKEATVIAETVANNTNIADCLDKKNAHWDGNKCVCDKGYAEKDGECLSDKDLRKAAGQQFKEESQLQKQQKQAEKDIRESDEKIEKVNEKIKSELDNNKKLEQDLNTKQDVASKAQSDHDSKYKNAEKVCTDTGGTYTNGNCVCPSGMSKQDTGDGVYGCFKNQNKYNDFIGDRKKSQAAVDKQNNAVADAQNKLNTSTNRITALSNDMDKAQRAKQDAEQRSSDAENSLRAARGETVNETARSATAQPYNFHRDMGAPLPGNVVQNVNNKNTNKQDEGQLKGGPVSMSTTTKTSTQVNDSGVETHTATTTTNGAVKGNTTGGASGGAAGSTDSEDHVAYTIELTKPVDVVAKRNTPNMDQFAYWQVDGFGNFKQTQKKCDRNNINCAYEFTDGSDVYLVCCSKYDGNNQCRHAHLPESLQLNTYSNVCGLCDSAYIKPTGC